MKVTTGQFQTLQDDLAYAEERRDKEDSMTVPSQISSAYWDGKARGLRLAIGFIESIA